MLNATITPSETGPPDSSSTSNSTVDVVGPAELASSMVAGVALKNRMFVGVESPLEVVPEDPLPVEADPLTPA
jgi:hypothetical protein